MPQGKGEGDNTAPLTAKLTAGLPQPRLHKTHALPIAYYIHRSIFESTKRIDMDLLLSLIALGASIFCIMLFSYLAWIRNEAADRTKVPEATGSWPIIGHMYLLAGSQQVPHKLLGSMADKFGPIFTMKLGVRRVLIVSNSELAKECLTTNDRVFASRPKAMSTELIGYNYAIFSLTSNYSYWREIRKIVVLELMSHRHLQKLAHIRASEVESSIKGMYRTWMRNKGFSKSVKIDITQVFGNLILNLSVKMIFGNRFSPDQENGDRFKRVLRTLTELSSAFVPSDVIPGLRWLDLGGYEKKMKNAAKELDVIFERWLEIHTKKLNSTQTAAGKIDDKSIEDDQVFMLALLSRVKELKEENLYGFDLNTIVKATCLTMLGAATDTTIVTLTWALSLLVNNPLVLEKAQQELDHQVGRERKVEESDLKNLVYLDAIIKETMRLYPAVPFLLPHESIEDCVVGGYTIPKGTQLLVNTWKIQHDPQIWSDPFEFQPERFLTSNKDIDLKGQHFELIPFGSGRRICVGMYFALETLRLTLGNIIHGFQFQNPSHDEKIDMTESPGLTNLKATPLELLVTPRLLSYSS